MNQSYVQLRGHQRHPYPREWFADGRAVVYYARVAHAFSAGIKCRHCMLASREGVPPGPGGLPYSMHSARVSLGNGHDDMTRALVSPRF